MTRYHLPVWSILLGFLLLTGTAPLVAQTPVEPIDSFAKRYDSLFMAAYDHRDIPAYDRLMGQWQDRCRRLPPDERKRLAYNTANAWYNFTCTYAREAMTTRALDCLDNGDTIPVSRNKKETVMNALN